VRPPVHIVPVQSAKKVISAAACRIRPEDLCEAAELIHLNSRTLLREFLGAQLVRGVPSALHCADGASGPHVPKPLRQNAA